MGGFSGPNGEDWGPVSAPFDLFSFGRGTRSFLGEKAIFAWRPLCVLPVCLFFWLASLVVREEFGKGVGNEFCWEHPQTWLADTTPTKTPQLKLMLSLLIESKQWI